MTIAPKIYKKLLIPGIVLYYLTVTALSTEAFSFSSPPSPSSQSLPPKDDSSIKKTVGGSSIGVRPDLNKDTQAHRSTLELSSTHGIDIDIRKASEEKGLGVFATTKIPLGTFLGKYDGEILEYPQVQRRYWNTGDKNEEDLLWEDSRTRRGQGVTGHYLFGMPNGSYVDAEDADVSSWPRFLNHADEGSEGCNVKYFHKAETGDEIDDYPLMFTIEDIDVGEEMCFDYGKYFFD